jgi:hypothetical protein
VDVRSFAGACVASVAVLVSLQELSLGLVIGSPLRFSGFPPPFCARASFELPREVEAGAHGGRGRRVVVAGAGAGCCGSPSPRE